MGQSGFRGPLRYVVLSYFSPADPLKAVVGKVLVEATDVDDARTQATMLGLDIPAYGVYAFEFDELPHPHLEDYINKWADTSDIINSPAWSALRGFERRITEEHERLTSQLLGCCYAGTIAPGTVIGGHECCGGGRG